MKDMTEEMREKMLDQGDTGKNLDFLNNKINPFEWDK